jgi:hypothetical protein
MYYAIPRRTQRRRSLGALGAPYGKQLATTGVSIGTTAAVSTIGAGTAIGSFAGPIGAAAGLIAGLLLSMNHPHGTCAPNAQSMQDFLKCWKHSIPNDMIPIWTDMWGGSDGKGWVVCPGAVGGNPPTGGCAGKTPIGAVCDPNMVGGTGIGFPQPWALNPPPPGRNAVACAPPGTTASLYGGGYQGGGSGGSAADSVNASSGTVGGIPAWMLAAAALGLLVFL